MKKPVKIKSFYLYLATIFSLLGLLVLFYTSKTEITPYYNEQLKAAEIMEQSESYLKEIVLERDILIEDDDINKTGLIGPEFSELTTTPGNIEAKRTALNPDFAALLVKYFYEAHLKKGDVIAVGTSGSFPGLVIATLCAAESYGLNTRIIASYGSSMHGGTRPDFNIIDIILLLKKQNLLNFNLLAVSPGGANDYGEGVLEGILYEGTREMLLKKANQTGAEVINISDLGKNIKKRLTLYGENIKLFVNIGGASANCGTSSYTLAFPQGLVLDPPRIPTTANRGLNYEFASKGLPVINLLNVRLLCEENGIKYDPYPLPEIGESSVYYDRNFNFVLLFAIIVITVSILVIGFINTKKDLKDGSEK